MYSKIFSAYAEQIIKYRFVTILLVAVFTGFLGSKLMSLQIDMDQDTWVPQSHPYVKATKVLEKEFGGRNILVISVEPKDGNIYKTNILAKVQNIQNKIENLPEAIRHNVLSIAAKKMKDIRGDEEGLAVTRIMERVPQNEIEIAQLKERVENNPIYINSLVSPDSSAIAIIADFNIDTTKPSYSVLKAKLDEILDAENDDTVEIYVAGLPIDFASFEHHMMQMPIFFGAALLIIMIIQYISFRSFQGMILPIVTAILSVFWSLGFMGLIGVHMDGMNTTTPILIMAVAAGHAIQILKRYYEEFYKLQQIDNNNLTMQQLSRKAIVEAIGRIGPVMFIAGLIASISFYTLATNEVSVVKHFGVFAGSGILSALILEMTFIPALRAILPPPKHIDLKKEQTHGGLGKILANLAERLSGGQAPIILVSCLIVIAAFSLGAFRINVDNSLKNYSDADSQIRIDDDAINEKFGGTNTIYFLIEGEQADSIKRPDVLKAIDGLQQLMADQQQVGKTQSIVDIIKRINKAMHADNESFNVVPDEQNLIAQYILLYTLSGAPQDFDSYVNSDYSSAAIWTFLKTDSTNYAQSLNDLAQGYIASNFPKDIRVRMGGSLPQTIAGNDALTSGKFENIIQMAIVVFILSSLILRSLVGGIFVTTPLIIVVLVNFGVMGIFGVPLDMGTMTTAAMAIGIGADYELYLLFRFREEIAKTGDLKQATHNSLTTSGKAVIYVALSIAAGYSFLLSSGFAFYSRLAVMVIATMIVSAFGAIIFLRAMTVIFKPKFMFPKTEQNVEVKEKVLV